MTESHTVLAGATSPVPVLPHQPASGERETILRTIAYDRDEFCGLTLAFNEQVLSKVARSVCADPPDLTTGSLGKLERLPVELLHQICLDLDVSSLFHLRQVSRRARQVVHGMREYRTLAGPSSLNCLLALLRTRTAPRVTLSDFHRTLHTSACEFCRHARGQFVFLPTWRRCCFGCINDHPSIALMAWRSVEPVFGPRVRSLVSYLIMRTLPGTYYWHDGLKARTKFRKNGAIDMVPFAAVKAAYAEENGSEPDSSLLSGLGRFDTASLWRYLSCCNLPSYDPRSGEPVRAVSCLGCREPFEGKTDRRMQRPRYPLGAVYTEDAFLEHFKTCEAAQARWRAVSGQREVGQIVSRRAET